MGEFTRLTGIGPAPWWREREHAAQTCHLVARVETAGRAEGARALSALIGGFSVAVDGLQTLVFFAGRPLEADMAWPEVYQALCWEEYLPWRMDMEGIGRIVMPPVCDPVPATWSRVALASTGRSTWEAVQGRGGHLSSDWRLLATRSPNAGIPFVLAERDGACELDGVTEGARRDRTYASAVQLAPDGSTDAWWIGPQGVQDAVHEATFRASNVVDLFRSWAVTMGEGAGLVRGFASHRELGRP